MKQRRADEPLQTSMLPGGAVIPDASLKDPTLSAGARLLWVMLAEYQGKGVECFPSQEMLAVPLGVKVRQLQTFSKELENYARGDPPEQFPLIEVKRVWAEKDRKTRNIYNLLRQPFLAVNRMANGAEGAPLADGGNAQSSAHGSEGEVQDTAPAAPVMPSEEGGAMQDGAPPDDAQSSAHRPGGDRQETVAAQPTIPTASDTQSFAHRSPGTPDSAAVPPFIHGGDSDWVSYGRSPSDGGARGLSTKSQELRRQQAQPLAPALNRYADRPLGPGDCTPRSSAQKCKKCGATVKPVHMMIRLISGFFCEKCCPACHPAG